MKPKSSLKHGTGWAYERGCRCEVCRGAKSERSAAYKRQIKNSPVPDHVHGTTNGYSNYGCRCGACRDAARTARAERRSRQRSEQVEG